MSKLPALQIATLVAGKAEGNTELNAFDNALLNAGIGNWNLVKVTSILPPGAQLIDTIPAIPAGALVPAVYTYITSNTKNELISACIGVGLGKESLGIIMEHSHHGPASIAQEIVLAMLKEALKERGIALTQQRIISCEHRVKKVGCALAAAILWWR